MSDSGSGIFHATGSTQGWDVETAKGYLGIEPGDSGQDAAIQRTLDYVMSAVEKMLQRGILWRLETLTVYDALSANAKYLLSRYPLIDVFAINGSAPPDDLIRNTDPGWLRFISRPTATINPPSAVRIVYEGGYDVLPPDLERALWEMVQYAWNKTDGTTGAPSGSLGGGGDVKAVTVFDAFKLEYSDAASAGAGESSAIWGWLAPWASTLELYRSDQGCWVA